MITKSKMSGETSSTRKKVIESVGRAGRASKDKSEVTCER